MCINKKVVIGLVVAGVGVFLFAPSAFGAVLPWLIVAICPLSMLFMMRAMSGNGGRCGASGDGEDAEITRLRAELDQLRAEHAARARLQPRAAPAHPASDGAGS